MTRSKYAGLLALMCAGVTIWLLPSASLGEEVDLSRVDSALKDSTQRLADGAQQSVAPVKEGLQSTAARTKAALAETKRAAGAAGRRAQTRATATDPARQPPMHGTNPHGQGGVAVVDLNPSNERPLGANPDGSDSGPEDVVVGRARGEQGADGAYHGHITILALFGNEVAGVDSKEGETKNGPLQPIQAGVLDPLCTSTSGQVCLSVLTANSATTANGSSNDFAIARAAVLGLGVGAAESHGAISETADCQNAAGSGRTANVTTAGGPVAQVANSATTSQSCRGQAPKTASNSQVIGLGGTGIALPAAGCADGTPDTVVAVPLVATIVCNADEAAGASAVREALDVFAINVGTQSLVKETTAASEATTVAPPETGAQCADGVDNDNDGVIDAADPGCHTDGNANNPASYNPADNSEVDGGSGGNAGAGDESDNAQCSDNRDNDGDGRVDEDDPGCHSDGNPNNAASYNPDDDDEADDGGAGDVTGTSASSGDAGDDTGGGSLPVTGANIVALALAGLLMLAGGMLLRRREEGHAGA